MLSTYVEEILYHLERLQYIILDGYPDHEHKKLIFNIYLVGATTVL